MATTTRHQFRVRDHDAQGQWASNSRRYRDYAHELLAELETQCREVSESWPADLGPVLRDRASHPDLWRRCRVRDRTSDTVRIYAAMAVEGYLNFYGVLRLGQRVFDEHFERLGIVPKIRQLLLVCDNIEISRTDPIIVAADAVAGSRNSLVHPKTRELVPGTGAAAEPRSTEVPEEARRSVESMEEFFGAFLSAVPGASAHLAPPRTAA